MRGFAMLNKNPESLSAVPVDSAIAVFESLAFIFALLLIQKSVIIKKIASKGGEDGQ
jgi:hypothetical protein